MAHAEYLLSPDCESRQHKCHVWNRLNNNRCVFYKQHWSVKTIAGVIL